MYLAVSRAALMVAWSVERRAGSTAAHWAESRAAL